MKPTSPSLQAARKPTLPIGMHGQESLTRRIRDLKSVLGTRMAVPLRMCFGSRPAAAFGILMYHRIAEPTPGWPWPTWNVTPRQFRAQMEGLLACGYEPWPLRKVLDHHLLRKPIPRRAFVVTFDDIYANVYHHAWPVLKERRIPATVFLATAYLDSDRPFPFDDWCATRGAEGMPPIAWQPVSTQQCKEMAADGLIELGCHTHTHGDFRGRPNDLYHDLVKSLDVLRVRFGLTNATFAFPYGTPHDGYSSPALAASARRAGMLCALNTEKEVVSPDSDAYAWGRFAVEAHDTSMTLAAKLDGWYTISRQVWQRVCRPFRAGAPRRATDALDQRQTASSIARPR